MSIKVYPPQEIHVPVLLNASIDTLMPVLGDSYLDLTAGYGGHARRFLGITGNYKDSVLVDRDDSSIKELYDLKQKGVEIMHTDFVSASRQLIKVGRQFNIVLVDLGVSSPQLDQGDRGFSFTNSGPIDMRMDRRQALSAYTLVNKASKEEIQKIIVNYGEESIAFASRVANAIVKNRPLKTTEELANLVKLQYRGKWKKIHPATRTFQALRIEVNQELKQIEELLPMLPLLLKTGGRVAVISFHSLEDRLVKRFFKEQFESGYESILSSLTKKPLDGANYDVNNPRSRSSKLRAAVKK